MCVCVFISVYKCASMYTYVFILVAMHICV